MSKKIIAHTLVKNEENYIWYSVGSVIDYVDKVFIWDTGSTDKTIEIIHEIEKTHPGKVYFKEVGNVDINEFTSVRQKMLEETNSDWFMILDGDEVWWDYKIKEVVSIINEKGDSLDSIVSSYYNIVGDIYHYQEEKAGNYVFDGKKGHQNIRATNRRISGLHFKNPHGQLALVDENGISIQDRKKGNRIHMDISYLHFTNVARSETKGLLVPKREKKLKYEIGLSFPKDFYYPEAFFRPRPDFIPSSWKKMTKTFYFKAFLETPLKKVKRTLFRVSKSGY